MAVFLVFLTLETTEIILFIGNFGDGTALTRSSSAGTSA